MTANILLRIQKLLQSKKEPELMEDLKMKSRSTRFLLAKLTQQTVAQTQPLAMVLLLLLLQQALCWIMEFFWRVEIGGGWHAS